VAQENVCDRTLYVYGFHETKDNSASGAAKSSYGMKGTLKTETNANHIEIQFVPYRQHSWLRTSKTNRHSLYRKITHARASAFLVDRYVPVPTLRLALCQRTVVRRLSRRLKSRRQELDKRSQ
jgi:hypothetical protein